MTCSPFCTNASAHCQWQPDCVIARQAKNAILASAVKTLATAKKADKKATDAVTKAIAAVAKAQTASVKLHKSTHCTDFTQAVFHLVCMCKC